MDSKTLRLTTPRMGIIAIAIITALVHLYLAVSSPSFDIIFFLNFLGYIGLLAAYFLPLPVVKDYHGLVRWAFMAYAAVTIIAWIVVPGLMVWFAYIDKILEVVLIALLWFDK